MTLKQITDGTPDCACRFVPGKLNLQRCPLHAAAPDLLAVLKRAQEKLSIYCKQTGGVYEGGEGLQFLNADINAAVLRATEGK